MQLLDRLRGGLADFIRPKNLTSHELQQELLARRYESETGIPLTAETSLAAATAYMCVKILGETVGMLPLQLFRRLPDGKSRERATDNPLYNVTTRTPNPWQTSMEWRDMMQNHLTTSGNAYSIKVVVEGRVRELLPVTAARIEKVEQSAVTMKLAYHVRMPPNGSVLVIPQERMFHIPGMGFDGIRGMGVLEHQRETLALEIGMARHGARLFKQGTFLSGIIQHPGKMSEDAYNRLRDSFDEKFAGVSNAHRSILLEEGTTWQASGMTAEDAQFIESRKLQANAVAGAFRVPPHMVNQMSDATFSNIEHQGISFVNNTMGPWLERWQQRMNMTLLPADEQEEFYFEFDVSRLLQGDVGTRYKAYQTAILSGWLSPADVRAKENLNPGPDELDDYWRPVNVTAADDPPDPGNTNGNNPTNRLAPFTDLNGTHVPVPQ